MYVAVKGGEQAIAQSWRLLDQARRGDPSVPELSVAQIREQLRLAVDRVMLEGSLHDPDLAALALKQASGDAVEAIFLLRAFRTTLPRFGASEPLDTGKMAVRRRISAIFKDLPGGQVLGPTYDYTQRLLDFGLAEPEASGAAALPAAQAEQGTGQDVQVAARAEQGAAQPATWPRALDFLDREGLIESVAAATTRGAPDDLTRAPLQIPATRAARLQALARGDEGYLLALGYSTQRGYAHTHPFAGEIRMGEVAVEWTPDELGFAVDIGSITLTECQMVNQFGAAERKAMAMALVDRSLRAADLGEDATAPGQDAEFVLSHCDNIEATGFVEHLKLPHYVDFQSELEAVRRMRAEAAAASGEAA